MITLKNMAINYLKYLLINIIFSALIFYLVFVINLVSGFWNVATYIILAGFIFSFFIKERKFFHYIKSAFLNSLFFGLLLALMVLYIFFMEDSQFLLVHDSIFKLALFFITTFLYIALFNFFGGLMGIIPKGIIERIEARQMNTKNSILNFLKITKKKLNITLIFPLVVILILFSFFMLDEVFKLGNNVIIGAICSFINYLHLFILLPLTFSDIDFAPSIIFKITLALTPIWWYFLSCALTFLLESVRNWVTNRKRKQL